MKLFGFNRKGFLYIDNGKNLISQQTTSGESQMLDNYCTLIEYDNYDDALAAFEHHKPKPISKKDVIHNEIHNSNIGMRFQEEAINQMYDEHDDYHTGF